MSSHIAPVPLELAYRLLNHGPSVLVSAESSSDRNLMSAAWVCPLDFSPPKVTIVLDKATYTRGLAEKTGYVVLHVPSQLQAALVHQAGTTSQNDSPDKTKNLPCTWFSAPNAPQFSLVENCLAWLVCRIIPEPHIQKSYDLFIAEVEAAWADTRVFSNGVWHFENTPNALKTIHYIAGGQFYTIGDSLQVHS